MDDNKINTNIITKLDRLKCVKYDCGTEIRLSKTGHSGTELNGQERGKKKYRTKFDCLQWSRDGTMEQSLIG